MPFSLYIGFFGFHFDFYAGFRIKPKQHMLDCVPLGLLPLSPCPISDCISAVFPVKSY